MLDHIAEALGWLAECDKLFHSCSHHPRKLDSHGSLTPHQEGSQVDVLILQWHADYFSTTTYSFSFDTFHFHTRRLSETEFHFLLISSILTRLLKSVTIKSIIVTAFFLICVAPFCIVFFKVIIVLTMVVREAILYQIGCFFTHCVKGGGGSNPCVKIYVANLYHSEGLLTT